MELKEIEHTLGELDDKVGRLRALYEQYFMGIEKLEPQTPRKEVDRVIAQLRKTQLRNTAQRFRFQTIIQRYNTMQQHWSRTLREMEAGTFRRDVLRAAERFGVDEAVTAVGKRRAAKMTAALEQKRTQEKEREKVRRRSGEPGQDEFESVSDADIVEEDDDDDAPTPPPLRPKPAPAQVWELHDPGEELTYVPPGAESIPSATASGRPLGINPFGGRARSPSISQVGQAVDPSDRLPGLDATAPYPSAVQLNLTEGAEKVEKKTAGGLRLGGGPRRASAEALSRIASALGGDAVTAPPPAVTAAPPPLSESGVSAVPPARPSSSGAHAGFRAPQASPGVSSPSAPGFSSRPAPQGGADATPAGVRKPLLSQPLDIDLSGMGAPAPPARPSAPAQPPAPPQPRKPLLSQPLDIDALGAAPAPDSSRTAPGAGLRPPPAASRPPTPRAPESAPSRTPNPAASRPEPAAPKDLSDQRMREIYSQYVQTRRERNEPTTNITYEKLSESLRSQTEKLKQKHASKKIDYEIVVKDGKTLIKPIVR
jgi:hypothetical protein